MHIDSNSTAEEMTPGGTIYQAANSLEFKTGDWRSMCPVWIKEKCKQCGLCFPVCPDDSIPVNKDGNREDFNYQQIDKNIKSSNLIKIFIYKKVKNGKQDKIK